MRVWAKGLGVRVGVAARARFSVRRAGVRVRGVG